MRILIVEDETPLRDEIAHALEKARFVVDASGDGNEGLHLAQDYPIDAAIIDLGLPGLSGLDLIRGLRARHVELPILILTARGRWQDKVEGLEAGADDYLTKPFHMEELLARLRALVRRASGWSQPVLSAGPISLNPATESVTCGGDAVALTAFEYRVLHYLLLHLNEPVSKSTLTEHIYPDDADRDSNVIEVFIRRLRQKLDPDGSLKPIETLRGRGYRLRFSRSAQSPEQG